MALDENELTVLLSELKQDIASLGGAVGTPPASDDPTVLTDEDAGLKAALEADDAAVTASARAAAETAMPEGSRAQRFTGKEWVTVADIAGAVGLTPEFALRLLSENNFHTDLQARWVPADGERVLGFFEQVKDDKRAKRYTPDPAVGAALPPPHGYQRTPLSVVEPAHAPPSGGATMYIYANSAEELTQMLTLAKSGKPLHIGRPSLFRVTAILVGAEVAEWKAL